jgi:hypothetical protein
MCQCVFFKTLEEHDAKTSEPAISMKRRRAVSEIASRVVMFQAISTAEWSMYNHDVREWTTDMLFGKGHRQ